MPPSPDVADDASFEIALSAWRQFHRLHLDDRAPTQPEIDARLERYRRAHETAALRHFGAAALLLAGVGRALADGPTSFLRADTAPEILVFLVTCGLLVGLGTLSLTRLRQAVEHRGMAQRIGTDSLSWSKVDSLFADTRDPAVRGYLHGVRDQGRPLRRAEAAVLLERSRGASPADPADGDAFHAHVRERSGPRRREMATVLACLLAALAARLPDLDPAILLPGLILLGAWCLAAMLGTALQLLIDPWRLRGGGARCRRLRLELGADLVPQAAVILAVIATTTGLAGLPR